MRNLKIHVRQENGYSPLNAENNRGVSNRDMLTYAHEKIYILLSVLSIFFSFFYEFNLNTQGFVYLAIVQAILFIIT